jgi:hypothetical protein
MFFVIVELWLEICVLYLHRKQLEEQLMLKSNVLVPFYTIIKPWFLNIAVHPFIACY